MELRTDVKKRKKNSKRNLKLYKLIFLAVIFWFLGSSLYSVLLSFLIDTQIVNTSTIYNKYPLEGLIIRDEVLISSPVTGNIIKKVNSLERVAKDSTIIEIESSGGTYLENGKEVIIKAPQAGVVSYITDGLESILKPNELVHLNIEKVKELKGDIVDNTTKNVVEKGKRFCKIVNNLSYLQMYLEFPLDIYNKPLQLYQKILLRIPELEREVYANIIDLKGIGDTAKVLVQIPQTHYDLLNKRIIPIEIIVDKKQGILIPKKALVVKEKGENGVYWLRKGFVFWQPVKILLDKGDKVLVEGIEPLTEIVVNPGLISEGQYLYRRCF